MSDITSVLDRLDKIERAIRDLVTQKPKQFYTTAEVGEIVGRSEYTIREYCRKEQIRGKKSANGRGWLVPHEELERLRNEGPRPE